MAQRIIDNKQNGILGDVIKENIEKKSKLSIISSYFTIYAFENLKKELNGVEEMRFLFTENYFNGAQKKTPFKTNTKLDILGDNSEGRFRNKLYLKQVSKECAGWVKQKVKVRAAMTPGAIGTKFIHVDNPNEPSVFANTSLSNFTSSGLGYAPSDALMMNSFSDDESATKQMLQYFDNVWNNPALVEDIKNDVMDQLEYGFKDYSPEFVYYFTLYNLFKDYLDELDEEQVIKTKTGFKETMVWNKLYKFQQDGVIGAIDKIEKHGGCILADSTGLGKTFSALAVIKYYELRNDRVLVLCPKKLRENWTVYTLNDKRNVLLDDRFNYDVLNHTDLTRDSGFSGEINLETVNWSNYDLVCLDESHNFRNNNPSRQSETRYSRLMNRIIKSGVKTKVLMLSATPVNNRMNDLKNQVAFITEGRDDAFVDNKINSIQEVMKRAQTQFNSWLKDSGSAKNVTQLLDKLDARYFRLLDLITIARSRKHIEKYYDINEIGKFPTRLKPINLKSDIDLNGLYPELREVNREIRKLNLSAYSPLKYVRADKQKEYSNKYDLTLNSGSIFKQIDREQSLIHLMRVNLLKRMESSINSFGLTLEHLLFQVDGFIDKIQNKSEYYDENLNIDDIEIDDPELEDFLIGNKVKVLLQDMDIVRWKQDLLEDKDRLNNLLHKTSEVTASRDAKYQDLKHLIVNKLSKPINPNNKKIIIFTAFADTAKYLYDNIAPWGQKELKLHTALVTGTGTNKTTLKDIKTDLNAILTHFSPISKDRDKIYPEVKEDIDILIATDCISEGQNLQDCDYLVNYDIHWNPVRCIQRWGRIDRIGSINDKVQLVNFWPNLELDEYIDLEARVSGRMILLDISATGEENVIEPNKEMNDLAYRRQQLEQLQDTVIDMEDMHGGISITDLTMSDFKMDLMDYLKDHQSEMDNVPAGIHSITKVNMDEMVPGVIFCLKHTKQKDDKHTEYNALAPYYLVYIGDDGEILLNITQSKRALDYYQKLCKGQKEVAGDLLGLFNDKTKNGSDMKQYVGLLETSVQSIIGKSQEKGTASLFGAGGTTTFAEEINSLDDFEVVSFLLIEN